MQLLTDKMRAILLENGARFAQAPISIPSVVILFRPDDAATWLSASAEPDEPDMMFGLCDLGVGLPELGRLAELADISG